MDVVGWTYLRRSCKVVVVFLVESVEDGSSGRPPTSVVVLRRYDVLLKNWVLDPRGRRNKLMTRSVVP